MVDTRRKNFDTQTRTQSAAGEGGGQAESGIWELPDHILETVAGALDFYETVGGGIDFAQNFSCFAQGVGDFSLGTPPKPKEVPEG